MSRVWMPNKPTGTEPETQLRVYTGEILRLRLVDLEYFGERFEIARWTAMQHIQRGNTSGRYLLPIYDPKGLKRGVVARKPWDGAPEWASPPDHGPKAITYRHMWGPVQSHYFGVGDGCADDPLVLVEDQLSAIKLAAHGYDSVALLGTPADVVGTYGGSDRVAEIAARARTHDEVIVALDADATDAAFMFVRKWGSAFRQIRVAILSKDIKDTPAAEFTEVLGT